MRQLLLAAALAARTSGAKWQRKIAENNLKKERNLGAEIWAIFEKKMERFRGMTRWQWMLSLIYFGIYICECICIYICMYAYIYVYIYIC